MVRFLPRYDQGYARGILLAFGKSLLVFAWGLPDESWTNVLIRLDPPHVFYPVTAWLSLWGLLAGFARWEPSPGRYEYNLQYENETWLRTAPGDELEF